MAVKKPTAAEKAALKEQKEAYYKGRYRYYTVEDGVKTILPDYMATPYYKSEGLEREICYGLDENLEPMWKLCADAPHPARRFGAEDNGPLPNESLVAPPPPFDYQPPAYASDQFSGGPANFDGAAGGMNNPRNPLLEGEIPEQYQASLATFREELLQELREENTKTTSEKLEDFKKQLDLKGAPAGAEQ